VLVAVWDCHGNILAGSICRFSASPCPFFFGLKTFQAGLFNAQNGWCGRMAGELNRIEAKVQRRRL
jgi:hypothetical protein